MYSITGISSNVNIDSNHFHIVTENLIFGYQLSDSIILNYHDNKNNSEYYHDRESKNLDTDSPLFDRETKYSHIHVPLLEASNRKTCSSL